MIHICAWSESKKNELGIWVFIKHFHMYMCKNTRMSKMNVKKEKAVTYDLMIK